LFRSFGSIFFQGGIIGSDPPKEEQKITAKRGEFGFSPVTAR
jgi:hypothetical protein